MSVAATTASAPQSDSRLGIFWATYVGKKVLMALSAVILVLFTLGHMLGNAQIYMGRDSAGVHALNKYAAMLHGNQGLLWTVRVILLSTVLVHAVAGVQLYLAKAAARPIPYQQKDDSHSTPASRTMIWSGLLILFFVVYHLMHLTTGTVHSDFVEGDVIHNVVAGFRNPLASGFYVIAMVGLGFHLWHGVYSMFQSLGIAHPRFTPGFRKAAAFLGTLLALVNISFPVAVLTGLVKG